MTIHEKVKKMHVRMAEMRDAEVCERRRRCFALLHDAVVHTRHRIDYLGNDSLIGFIELSAIAASDLAISATTVQNRLSAMGFSTEAAS